jgi:hypothetical protein
VYGYVTKQVASLAQRLDHFLTTLGIGPHDEVTVLSDSAGEFEKAARTSVRPTKRILDWFRIAMQCQAIENSARHYWDLVTPSGRTLEQEVATLKWLICTA